MAPGTRTPNGRMMSGIYAGLPRNLNTELAAKTDARPAAVFCLETTAKLRPNTKPKSDEARHLTPAVTGAGAQRREPKAPRFWRPVDRLVKSYCFQNSHHFRPPSKFISFARS